MVSIQAKREQRAATAKEMRNMLDQKGDRRWSADEQAKYDALGADIEACDKEISNIQRLVDVEREENFADVDQFRRDPKDPTNKSKNLKRDLFAKMLREGPQALGRDDLLQIRNTLSTGTGSQGGFTIQTDIARELIDLLKGYRGVRDVASRMATATGMPMSYPSSDGTSELGEWVAENTTAAAADPVFGTVALNTFKAGSKSIAVPIELLQDAEIDIVAMVNKRVADRIGRVQNVGFTTGSGTGQPFGIVTQSSAGKVGTTGQTTTVIYDDLVDLFDSVDYAYGQGKFMFSQATRRVVRKIKDTAGRPIWTPSYDAGASAATPDSLLGVDVVINNDMASMAANAKPIIYGAFDRYMIRDAMEVTLFRFEDSAFMLKGQIGFVAWCRVGGNLLDTTAVKYYQNSAT